MSTMYVSLLFLPKKNTINDQFLIHLEHPLSLHQTNSTSQTPSRTRKRFQIQKQVHQQSRSIRSCSHTS